MPNSLFVLLVKVLLIDVEYLLESDVSVIHYIKV